MTAIGFNSCRGKAILLSTVFLYLATGHAEVVSRKLELVGLDLRGFTPVSKLAYGKPKELTCVPLALLNSLQLSGCYKFRYLL